MELWHAGAALRLAMSADGVGETTYVLGPDMTLGTGTEAAGVQAAGVQANAVGRRWCRWDAGRRRRALVPGFW